jgi:hypothetical protein
MRRACMAHGVRDWCSSMDWRRGCLRACTRLARRWACTAPRWLGRPSFAATWSTMLARSSTPPPSRLTRSWPFVPPIPPWPPTPRSVTRDPQHALADALTGRAGPAAAAGAATDLDCSVSCAFVYAAAGRIAAVHQPDPRRCPPWSARTHAFYPLLVANTRSACVRIHTR